MLARIDLRPDRRKLRQFGWTALVAFGLLGVLLVWRGGLFGVSFGSFSEPIAHAFWTLALISALFSLVWPSGNRPLYLLLAVIAFPLGWLLSHVILMGVFYLILTPVGLVFRLIGRDPLERRFVPERPSYWDDLPETPGTNEYFRQF